MSQCYMAWSVSHPHPTQTGRGQCPVHRLRVVKRLPLERVCESVLHGMVSISPSRITNREGLVFGSQTQDCEVSAHSKGLESELQG